MRAGVDAMLAKMVAAGSSGVEWSLVTATLTRRVDVLDKIFDGQDEVLGAWRVAVERCAGAANARGDTARCVPSVTQGGDVRTIERRLKFDFYYSNGSAGFMAPGVSIACMCHARGASLARRGCVCPCV